MMNCEPEWIRGDKNNPVGRVLVYGVNLDRSWPVKYPGLAGALDIEGLLKLTKREINEQAKEQFSELLKKLENIIKEFAEKKGLKSGSEVQFGIEQPIIPIILENPDDIDRYDCDVLRSDVLGIMHTHKMLDSTVKLYLATYELWLSKGIKVDKKYISKVPNFKDIKPDEFKQHIAQLVSMLMHELTNKGNTDRTFADLVQLASGSSFMQDVHNFYNLASTEHPHKLDIMSLYMQKIFAVLDERYEEVPVLIRKIDEIK